LKELVTDSEFADWIEGKIGFRDFKNYALIEKRRRLQETRHAKDKALSEAVTSGKTLEEYRRENVNKRKRDRYHSGLGSRMRVYLSTMVNKRIRDRRLRASKSARTEELLGCSVDDFMKYIESKWLPGMSWENWGTMRHCWQLDHIKPCASFDLSKPEDQRLCFHFTNYQPLWSIDNFRKGAKLGP
jgi:hypothetical protein